MASKYWIKLYHEMIHDPKMGRLPDGVWRRAIEMFLLAGELDDEGYLPDTSDMAWLLRLDESQLLDDLRALAAVQIVQERDGRWFVTKFSERQAANDDADRMRRYRERKQRAQYRGDAPVTPPPNTSDAPVTPPPNTSDAPVTPPPNTSDAPVTTRNVDTDTDTDTDEIRVDADADAERETVANVAPPPFGDPPEQEQTPITFKVTPEEFGEIFTAWENARGGTVNATESELLSALVDEYGPSKVREGITTAVKYNKFDRVTIGYLEKIVKNPMHYGTRGAPGNGNGRTREGSFIAEARAAGVLKR